ncbi:MULTISPECIES: transcription termination factor Rho [unclassified Streptomyces]|uniref:transcription termination factor Rho n=1 Tax=unclassified Streptomyces TaxID=2593676 RepID=UPI00278BDA51|nr:MULTISPECIES: transcription termination factor Rho [unclassified Streptomyces]
MTTATTTTTSNTTTDTPHQEPVRAAGVLDIGGNGPGFLRSGDLMPTSHDVQVPAHLVRRLGLRKGDLIEGTRAAKPRTLTAVETVNGAPAEAVARRPRFADLTPLHPSERLRLEHPAAGLAGRVVDLFTPVGKGQRGLIVAPPRTGKTVLLQQLAAAIAANHPEVHLMVLLVDERPEEVTDMRRSVRGEVYASTFDRPAKAHIGLAELAVERAKRLTEQGRDVVILLDSLTRLCRAHNNAASSGGRTLSGGVDAAALLGPKRLFGAARDAEEAGSLTVLATALVDTGSRADDYYFEELKSTGNMELRLDRTLAQARVHPAVDLTPSGTRREELLLPAPALAVSRGLRRALQGRDGTSGYEALLDKLRQTPDNAAFLRQAHSTVPGA